VNPPSQTTRLELPPSGSFLGPALALIESFAEQAGMETNERHALREASGLAIEMVMESSRDGDAENRVGIDVFETNGSLTVEVLNRGVPIFLNTQTKLFHQFAPHLDRLSIENLGRQGQTLVLGKRLGEEALRRRQDAVTGIDVKGELQGEITIRELRVGEEEALSQLFYFVYGYNYINELVYFPEKLREKIQSGELISIVGALPDGRLVGHVGLYKWNHSPVVYEPCLGVTDPRVKSRGLFSQIFQKTMDRVKQTPMQYCFFDFVTNHDLSQRFVSRYQPCDLSIFLGCQSKATQAKLEKLGLGIDPPEMDRYSLLFSVLPRVKHPFGEEVVLPAGLGETLEFLLKPLNLRWRPAPRFDLLPSGGDYQTHFQTSQNSVVFDLFQPGRRAVEKIVDEWHQLLRSGYHYAAVEAPLDYPGMGNLYDILAGEGFFISGFIPYHYGARLGFRFQAIGPTKVAWDDIKVFTADAKRLLALIRQNYERNGLL